MILLSHPTGNANVRQAALALEEAGLLAQFWTCLGWRESWSGTNAVPAFLRSRLLRRALPESLSRKVRLRPLGEALRLSAGMADYARCGRVWRRRFDIDGVYRDLDRVAARHARGMGGLGGVYAYEDGALDVFRWATYAGLSRIYELPIGYWRAWEELLAEEREREPEWADTLQGAQDSQEKRERKDRELALADCVIAASSFTRVTLGKAPAFKGKVELAAYGAPRPAVGGKPRKAGNVLEVIFVGALTQRKGLSYLLRAAELLRGRIRLTLIGRRTESTCRALDRALSQHRWMESVSQEIVLREMRASDVLVFPSLFEGFGLVILEALSQGLPVITTRHTVGPDILEDGKSGFIVPIRSAEAITEKLERLIEERELLMSMKAAAMQAAEQWTWEGYRSKLVCIVRDHLASAR
jgi:glycosyltransferase involved in cell wall biosynthesis